MRVYTAILAISGLFSASAANLQFGSSTFTAGVGGVFPQSGAYTVAPFHDGPTFSGEYEFGLHKFLAADIGVENFLPNYDTGSRLGGAVSRERVTLLSFGLRGVLPLGGRAELFAGTGGAKRGSSNDFNPYGNSLLWQLNGGVRLALDRAKHWRVGPTVRLYRDLGRPTEEWLSVTGEVGYRFGR